MSILGKLRFSNYTNISKDSNFIEKKLIFKHLSYRMHKVKKFGEIILAKK